MFREGQYLEVIKIKKKNGKRHFTLLQLTDLCIYPKMTSDGCLATAIVTIKEKTVEYKRKAMKTNKWLDLQDWASLYGIIRKAVIRNNENRSNGKTNTTERRKCTRHLEVTYKFEDAESPEDRTSLPTIRVTVKPARKNCEDVTSCKNQVVINEVEKYGKKSSQKAKKNHKSREKNSFLSENYSPEEYVPPALPSSTIVSASLKYVPSRKSMLLRMRCSTDENKYTPTSSSDQLSAAMNGGHTEVSYVPNSIKSLAKLVHETYDPCATILAPDLNDAYVPNSKGARIAIEEYEPDFASKTMKFDDSYVPSSTSCNSEKEESKKRSRKSLNPRNKKSSTSRSFISEISKCQL